VLTGVRPGELIALRWTDIKKDKVTIMQSINDSGELTQGKNKNARRTFKIGELALIILDDQRELLNKLGVESKFVFPARDGDHISQKQFRFAWQRYCIANGFEKQVTPYELRHTFVSINDELPEALKKMVIGHSKSMDTEGTYGHEKQGDMDKAAVYIDAAFMKFLK
jgi:integrase